MIEEIRSKVTLIMVNAEQFKLLKHVFTMLGEEIVDVESETIFNQITYVDYSPTRGKWMVRSIVFENEKIIVPLVTVIKKLCEANNIEYYCGHSDGVTCIEAGGEMFTFEV